MLIEQKMTNKGILQDELRHGEDTMSNWDVLNEKNVTRQKGVHRNYNTMKRVQCSTNTIKVFVAVVIWKKLFSWQ